ncbi:prefoldin subunit 4-like [Pomacea canaliculata]|uniref:prefoldin subunit 4-like n=1 Tax=Pomacea canaliculata TaxID=400727 RepID=UPI000D732C62|nr:prefoldin subunit 4-like [Pomacea canaliculata]
MAGTVKENDSDAQVTLEDQQKINKFARHNAKMQDLKEELVQKKKQLENLEDASDELLMLEDELVPYQIGELFVSTSAEEASQLIEASKSTVKAEIATIEAQLETHKKTLSDLKVQLYAKFGSNINLEAEED